MSSIKENKLRLVKEEKVKETEVFEHHEMMTIETARFLEDILETISFKERKTGQPLLLDLNSFSLKYEADNNPSVRLADLLKFKKALTKKIRIESLLATKEKLKMYFSGCGLIATIPIVRIP